MIDIIIELWGRIEGKTFGHLDRKSTTRRYGSAVARIQWSMSNTPLSQVYEHIGCAGISMATDNRCELPLPTLIIVTPARKDLH